MTDQAGEANGDPSAAEPETTQPSPEEAPQKASRSEQTRARILDAAEEVFGEHGYHGASIVEITKRAGHGLGTFYLYFPSKIEIYRHLLRARQHDFIEAARAATAGTSDQRSVVRGAFRVFFDWIAERPAIMRLLREAEFVDPSLLEDLYRAPAEEYRKRLARARELGYLADTDPEVLAWCIMGMTEFVVLRFIIWGEEKSMTDEQFDAFAEIVVRALGVGRPR
jgi:AcrR family transcriptional regulator